jgi:hypothetical protein
MNAPGTRTPAADFRRKTTAPKNYKPRQAPVRLYDTPQAETGLEYAKAISAIIIIYSNIG